MRGSPYKKQRCQHLVLRKQLNLCIAHLSRDAGFQDGDLVLAILTKASCDGEPSCASACITKKSTLISFLAFVTFASSSY